MISGEWVFKFKWSYSPYYTVPHPWEISYNYNRMRNLINSDLRSILYWSDSVSKTDGPKKKKKTPNKITITFCLFGDPPPTASSMVPVSSRVLNDRLISVSTASDRPLSSMYPGLEKLTVCRFCKQRRNSFTWHVFCQWTDQLFSSAPFIMPTMQKSNRKEWKRLHKSECSWSNLYDFLIF